MSNRDSLENQVETGSVLVKSNIVSLEGSYSESGVEPNYIDDDYIDLLNTNADTIAASCAIGLSEFFDVRLIFCFEKRGVLLDTENENSVIANMNQVLYEKYKTEGIIDGGMIPKLDNSFDALKKGVKEVIITSAELLGSNKGTHISLE